MSDDGPVSHGTPLSVARKRRVAWVATSIMPHEAAVRAWLARSRIPPDQIDDLVQEAYCKLAGLVSVEHIQRPGAYFFQIIRSLIADRIRQSRVVRLETVTEIDALPVLDDEPSPERIVAARRELAEVLKLIAALPARCRRIFELRKIEGLSQREVAAQLGITETIVENDIVKGMRLISEALRRRGAEPQIRRHQRVHGDARDRRRD